jgi:hypothetical protein
MQNIKSDQSTGDKITCLSSENICSHIITTRHALIHDFMVFNRRYLFALIVPSKITQGVVEVILSQIFFLMNPYVYTRDSLLIFSLFMAIIGAEVVRSEGSLLD